MWVELQYLCYYNTFVSAIIHNTFATIPLSAIPYTDIPIQVGVVLFYLDFLFLVGCACLVAARVLVIFY